MVIIASSHQIFKKYKIPQIIRKLTLLKNLMGTCNMRDITVN
jgi:hypothetical protein